MNLFPGNDDSFENSPRNFAATEDNSADAGAKRPSGAEVVTVSALNQRARRILEGAFSPLWVRGEISNLTRATSGHWYFSLKDERAQVRCAMFRARNALLGWQPRDGMAVEAYALVGLYEARGEFQLTIEAMRRAGVGALYERFEQLKAKLAAQGWFESARKRALPTFPRRIGIVTSSAGAALHDVLTTLSRRAPHISIIVYPSLVQGDAASRALVAAIATANARAECDTLIVCRGGGSIEDLWPFNEENVARAILESRIPIVTGIGHETDFTIADFVADARAPTPTGAAQLASPERTELLRELGANARRLQRGMARSLENMMQSVDWAQRRLVHPRERLLQQHTQLQQLAQRLSAATAQHLMRRAWQTHQTSLRWQRAAPALQPQIHALHRLQTRLSAHVTRQLAAHDARLRALASNLDHLNPHAVLARGYSIVKKLDGTIVRAQQQITIHDALSLQFARGTAQVRVEKTSDE